MTLAAHAHTVWPILRARMAPPSPPPARPWTLEVPDPRWGRVRLSGWLRHPAGSRDLLVLVHGLGGGTESRYMIEAAHRADALGLASLRLALRGADGRGEDVYHGGLSSDLAAAVASPVLAGFRRILVLGYSLGGHLVLRFATEVDEPRVRAVAAVSAPLDLAAGQRAIDRPGSWAYRRYLLGGMTRSYAAVARRRPLADAAQVRRVRTVYDFDARVVVPRFGFADPEDYYRRASVGPRLGDLRVPALLVAAAGDPMVPQAAIRPFLASAGDALEVRWQRRGGHVAFPARLDLGEDAPPGRDQQVMAWLLRQ